MFILSLLKASGGEYICLLSSNIKDLSTSPHSTNSISHTQQRMIPMHTRASTSPSLLKINCNTLLTHTVAFLEVTRL